MSLPPCPICGKSDLFMGADGKPGCPHCEVAVVLPPPTIRQLAVEIANLAHKGWWTPDNAEFLFTAIEERAKDIIVEDEKAGLDDRCGFCGCECAFRRCPCAKSGVFCTACGCDS